MHRLAATHAMRHFVTDVRDLPVCLTVCVGHAGSCAKTAEPIDIPVGTCGLGWASGTV